MKCKGCYYYNSISGNNDVNSFCCRYLIKTGKLRKITPAECYKKKEHLISIREVSYDAQ